MPAWLAAAFPAAIGYQHGLHETAAMNDLSARFEIPFCLSDMVDQIRSKLSGKTPLLGLVRHLPTRRQFGWALF